jgi:glycogen debranching enzyme
VLDGACFCISTRWGDVNPVGSQGLYFLDIRFLSELVLEVNGAEPELLDAVEDEPFAATFVGRCAPTRGSTSSESTLLVERRRVVGQGMRDDICVHNLADEASYCRLEVRAAADFADVRDVRDGTVRALDVATSVIAGGLELTVKRSGGRRGVRVMAGGTPKLSAGVVVWEVIVPARAKWATHLEILPQPDGQRAAGRFHPEVATDALHHPTAERLARWRRSVPSIETDHAGLQSVLARSEEDLGTLRVFDPEVPERAVVAGGAPWSMSLYGRDSLLTSWMALLVDPELALGVLETLARFQGAAVDPRTEEEPGRILHELRFGWSHAGTGVGFEPTGSALSLTTGRLAYGSIDATPLFVMLLGELRRWGLADELVERLLPHADRALAWIRTYGDRDGDGYVEYQRATDRGRFHQGWKDSPDAVRFADGTPAAHPIALAEVQGYVYSAFVARSHFAREAGDPDGEAEWRGRAVALRTAFNQDFWLEDKGWLAFGLDRDKRPIDALVSNMGHCLWTGILDQERAAAVAHRVMSDELFSGWGVRTLASNMAGYNPISYHAGSVWPLDNALLAAGLMRYGFVKESQRVIMGMIDAATSFGSRLPELFAGFSRDRFPFPISYPNACTPQACASAAPLLFLRTLLRFDPWIPAGRLHLAPALPPEIGWLRIDHVPLLGGKISLEVDGEAAKVEGLPPMVELVPTPRKATREAR